MRALIHNAPRGGPRPRQESPAATIGKYSEHMGVCNNPPRHHWCTVTENPCELASTRLGADANVNQITSLQEHPKGTPH